jgi:hypothetical protein
MCLLSPEYFVHCAALLDFIITTMDPFNIKISESFDLYLRGEAQPE